ncbi:MAG: hypothetical protein ACLPX5_13895 [Dissulfurispiraceae bacterium]
MRKVIILVVMAIVCLDYGIASADKKSEPVTVVNTPTQSLPVRNVDNPATSPIQLHATLPIRIHHFEGNAVFRGNRGEDRDYIVPKGKRLVIEDFSCFAFLPAGMAARLSVSTQTGTTSLPQTPPAPATSSRTSQTSAGRQVRLYGEAGSNVFATASLSDVTPVDVAIECNITGYLANVP